MIKPKYSKSTLSWLMNLWFLMGSPNYISYRVDGWVWLFWESVFSSCQHVFFIMFRITIIIALLYWLKVLWKCVGLKWNHWAGSESWVNAVLILKSFMPSGFLFRMNSMGNQNVDIINNVEYPELLCIVSEVELIILFMR